MRGTKKNKPLVSVVMPVYNGELFMAAAIESILSQTFKNFEFLVVDDGSNDLTSEILKKYKKNYPLIIKIFRLKKNIGAFAAINSVLNKTRGEFIALMDSDDISYPQRLEKQITFFKKNPNVIVLGCQAEIITENGLTIGNKKAPIKDGEIRKEFAFVHPMVHPSCILRKSLLPEKNHIYENKYGVNDDYFSFFKLLSFGQFANLEETLFSYRIHANNSSLKNLKKTLLNTIKIRFDARRTFNYRLPPLAFLVIPFQFLTFLIIPERLILKTYLMLRGIYSPKEQLARILIQIKYNFIKPVRFYFSFVFSK